MQQSYDRRHREREKYLVLRFYARVVSVLSYIAAVIGLLFGLLILLFADMLLPLRISNALLSTVMGATYFVVLQSTAQAIYLLFDVARNSRASREFLEKGQAAPPAPAGD